MYLGSKLTSTRSRIGVWTHVSGSVVWAWESQTTYLWSNFIQNGYEKRSQREESVRWCKNSSWVCIIPDVWILSPAISNWGLEQTSPPMDGKKAALWRLCAEKKILYLPLRKIEASKGLSTLTHFWPWVKYFNPSVSFPPALKWYQ